MLGGQQGAGRSGCWQARRPQDVRGTQSLMVRWQSRFLGKPNGITWRPDGQVKFLCLSAPPPDYHCPRRTAPPPFSAFQPTDPFSDRTTDTVALARLRRLRSTEIDDQIHDLMMRRAQMWVAIGA